MRTLVDIPKEDLDRLTELGKENHVPRAAIIREAISAYLEPRRQTDPAPGGPSDLRQFFGLWKDHPNPEDGLAMQERLRKEWVREGDAEWDPEWSPDWTR